MKQNIYVNVYESDDEDGLPSDPIAFMVFWQEKLDLVPAEFKDTAMIEVCAESRWECGYLEVKVSYIRTETDEEEAKREGAAKNRSDEIERKEREQLNKLREKYGA